MRARIEKGRYPGGKLPTVKDLSNDFGFAGQTVRDGMSILIREGLVISAGNRGYFIAENQPEKSTSNGTLGEEIKEMRLQIQALTERVAALEGRSGSGGA